jgi:hypothetical protein
VLWSATRRLSPPRLCMSRLGAPGAEQRPREGEETGRNLREGRAQSDEQLTQEIAPTRGVRRIPGRACRGPYLGWPGALLGGRRGPYLGRFFGPYSEMPDPEGRGRVERAGASAGAGARR